MSRARELAKVGGKNQQVIAGLSSHVGVSTFLNNVHMFANLDVGGNVTVTGTTTFNGGTLTLGDANTDNIVFGGEVDSHIIPDDDGTYDLGSSTKEWKDLYIDGTAHVDTLDVDENAGIIGNLTLTGNADFNGDLDVDGTANLDVVDIDGAVDMASNLVIAGNIDANGNLDVDGTTDLDTTNVVGTLTVTGDIAADNVTVNGNTVSTSSGGLTLDSTSGTTTVADALNVTGGTTTTALNANGDVNLGDATSDTITCTGRFDAALVPASDNAIDLGTSTLEYKDLYLDGTANIDSLVADTADINGGTADNVVIGGSTAAAGSFTTVAASSNVTVTGNLDVDGATTLDGLTVAEGAAFSSTLDVDGATTLDGLTVAEGATFSSTLGVSGTLTANGDVDLGNATSDTITATGRFDSDIVPSTDNARDLGASGLEFKDLYLDGTANIDSLVADTADINAGTIDNTVIGGSTAAAGSFTTISATGDVTLTDTTADSAAGPELLLYRNSASPADGDYLGQIKFQGESDTGATRNYAKITAKINDASNGSEDGILEFTHLKAGSNNISGRWNSTTLQLINGTDFSVAGDSSFTGDVTVTGALDANGGANIDNIRLGVANDNEIDTSSGNLVIDSAGGTTTIDDNLTVSGNLTVNGTTTTINSTTVAIDDKNFQVATGAADDAAADGAGLTVDSGDGDKTWNFEATGDNWGASENINIASGKVYKINNTSILSATTLGSSVVASSLTSVGTIASGVWQGTAIANGYLANSTVSYGGVSLSLGGSDATPAFDLSDATNYPTSSLSGTITNAQLAGSIAASKLAGSIGNAKLSNSTVSYGGIELALGASDATPAFDLTDATNYPTSSLSGTITNAQLAGSIAASKLAGSIGNSKLSNSSVSFGGVSLSLGGSDGTPAFDLSDATNYPTSSLSGTITNAQLAGSIADSKLSTISTANKISLSALNIDGGTDIGAALVDADEFIVDDGGGGTNRRSDMSRIKTYIYGAMSGDATAGSGGAVTLANSGVSAATYGSATAIPQITVDAKGRITSATTNTVNTTTNLGKSTAAGQITITSSTGDNVVIGEATSSIAGLMSTTHHDKLDGIAAGATNVTNTNQLTNGAGFITSADGGNAATLDSIDSSQFLRSDTADTMTATLTARAITPQADSTYDLGTNSVRWANVYADDVRTGDLHLSNEHRGGNTIDGSWGHYQIEEGSDDLFLKNRRTGKTYKFMLQEV